MRTRYLGARMKRSIDDRDLVLVLRRPPEHAVPMPETKQPPPQPPSRVLASLSPLDFVAHKLEWASKLLPAVSWNYDTEIAMLCAVTCVASMTSVLALYRMHTLQGRIDLVSATRAGEAGALRSEMMALAERMRLVENNVDARLGDLRVLIAGSPSSNEEKAVHRDAAASSIGVPRVTDPLTRPPTLPRPPFSTPLGQTRGIEAASASIVRA